MLDIYLVVTKSGSRGVDTPTLLDGENSRDYSVGHECRKVTLGYVADVMQFATWEMPCHAMPSSGRFYEYGQDYACTATSWASMGLHGVGCGEK